MQVKETLNEGLKRGYQFTLPAADLAAEVDRELAEAQPNVEMKGFRKGKVPMALLKKQYGPRVLGDAMQKSIDDALRADWAAELEEVRNTMLGLRDQLAAELRDLSGSDRFDFIRHHRGMFSRLGATPEQVLAYALATGIE